MITGILVGFGITVASIFFGYARGHEKHRIPEEFKNPNAPFSVHSGQDKEL